MKFTFLSIVPTECPLSLWFSSLGMLLTPHYRIFQIPKLGTKLKADSIPLSYTPRKFITHPHNEYFYIIEADHRTLGDDAAAKKLAELVCLFDWI